MKPIVFCTEAVTDGHPDKLCDQVSDAIVDRFLQQDPLSDVVAECAVATGILFVAARFASEASVDIPGLAREVVGDLGYRDETFNPRACTVMTSLTELPPGHRSRVDERQLDVAELDCFPATEPVTLFGFACTHTPALMPMPIWLSQCLARRLSRTAREEKLPWLSPDGKVQVGVEFQGRTPVRVHSVSLAVSCNPGPAPRLDRAREELRELIIGPTLRAGGLEADEHTHLFVNPDGELPAGGPALHSGLTGRKTAQDTYGEYARHSSAALSGKGPRRIDRAGAYAARHAAKNVVAAGLAAECEVQLTYAIGQARPVSVEIRTGGTGRIPDAELAERVQEVFELRPAGILRDFGLHWLPAERRGAFYRTLAAEGHMGRTEEGLPWEVTDRVDALR